MTPALCAASPSIWALDPKPFQAMLPATLLSHTPSVVPSHLSHFSHPRTNQARPCLVSEIRRDWAHSGWHGRRFTSRFYMDINMLSFFSSLKKQNKNKRLELFPTLATVHFSTHLYKKVCFIQPSVALLPCVYLLILNPP